MADETLVCALTIAGSDSGGGAGIQADLKTFTVLKAHGMSAITALTAQNTEGVQSVQAVSPEFVKAQIDAVIPDIGVNAVKTGMLANEAIVEVVSDAFERYGITGYILDPVMLSESGQRLLSEEGVEAMKRLLFPKALLITPNIAETEALTGMRIDTQEDMEKAAVALFDLGPGYVLVTGGHLPGGQAMDILYDGIGVHPFVADKVVTRNNHGTGCTFSAAITAYLAKGFEMDECIAKAKYFVHNALTFGLDIGKGPGPVNHFWNV
jgi:hydroxymethylpyrimidine/phosphomethylpyrimidine kinase